MNTPGISDGGEVDRLKNTPQRLVFCLAQLKKHLLVKVKLHRNQTKQCSVVHLDRIDLIIYIRKSIKNTSQQILVKIHRFA